MSDVPGRAYLQQEQVAVGQLSQALVAERDHLLAQARRFYGDDPVAHPETHYLERVLAEGDSAHEAWRAAMLAAQQAEAVDNRLARLNERAAALAHEVAAMDARWRTEQEAQARYREIDARRDIDVQALQAIRQAARERDVQHKQTLRVGAATLAGPAIISGATEAIRAEALRLALTALREAGAFAKPAADLLRKPPFWTLLVYSPALGDGELTPEQRRRFAVALPLADMGQGLGASMPDELETVELDYRLKAETLYGQTAVHAVPTGGTISAQVPVRHAQWQAEAQAYEVHGPDLAAPTLQVEPAVVTALPVEPAPALRGVTNLAHLGAATVPDGASTRFNDCVLVFPAEVGIGPCYVAFEDPLTGPGVATGDGQGTLDLRNLLANPGFPHLPASVAASLKWRTFESTDALSAEVWRALSHMDAETQGIGEINRNRLRKGYPPIVPRSQWSETRRTLQLRYARPPETLVEAYSLDNLRLGAEGGQPLLGASEPVHTPWLSAYPKYAEQVAAAQAAARAEAAAALEQERALQQQAEEAARANAAAADWLRAANRFTHMRASSAPSAFLLSPAGEVPLSNDAGASLETSLRSALGELQVADDGELAVDFLDLAFERPEGDFPPGIALSLPLEWLVPDPPNGLVGQAAAYSVELPYRIGSITEYDGASLFVTRTGIQGVAREVRVIRAELDSGTGSWLLIDDAASGRRLTWTPASAPGAESLGGTTLPITPALVGLYTGNGEPIAAPQLETYPGLHDWGIDDFIVVYPADSGLPPEYVMFSEAWRRYTPGVVSGAGQAVEGQWLDARVNTVGVPVPASVAERLRGRSFASFDSFRRAFWREVGRDLSALGAPEGIFERLTGFGRAIPADKHERAGRRTRLEIHHVKPISEGGEVYDVDNMIIVSPAAHIRIHKEQK
ncbi:MULTISPECIES: S-type pyocin domain-containing protein [Pseudomonas]|uniref:Pyosin/cloacin translocation domain-containing protein n=1 Tax=Pseudomonas quercus TaxID=2722792 RepID=A0ABX0YCN8_9PSED|nr:MULTISPECIES: S-type pyocin domain-containing protein [Pseudomonas]MBF7142547.1 S-type pyocin domain-containing protein [Pseudomonas sp. LY10J]NJP01085.1 hypothetical protein [Pseudomonas quercus]